MRYRSAEQVSQRIAIHKTYMHGFDFDVSQMVAPQWLRRPASQLCLATASCVRKVHSYVANDCEKSPAPSPVGQVTYPFYSSEDPTLRSPFELVKLSKPAAASFAMTNDPGIYMCLSRLPLFADQYLYRMFNSSSRKAIVRPRAELRRQPSATIESRYSLRFLDSSTPPWGLCHGVCITMSPYLSTSCSWLSSQGTP